ncbi:hypothetical protein, partial [Atlantibacter hermannii]|uniref:hypothetical protein n=1 Tax=Atlantibacter hermannii TaxID=565 RepID=UPI002FD97C33
RSRSPVTNEAHRSLKRTEQFHPTNEAPQPKRTEQFHKTQKGPTAQSELTLSTKLKNLLNYDAGA